MSALRKLYGAACVYLWMRRAGVSHGSSYRLARTSLRPWVLG
jgi:hypothetical protein